MQTNDNDDEVHACNAERSGRNGVPTIVVAVQIRQEAQGTINNEES